MQAAITNTQAKAFASEADTNKLIQCYKGELSAVETYELALKSINDVALHHALQEILVSHSRRVDLIRDRMIRDGISIPDSSGAWGAFTKGIQAGADLLSTTTAVSWLEEGEDRGLKLYTSDLESCGPDARTFITTQLLPEQQRTHQLCRQLQEYLKQPS